MKNKILVATNWTQKGEMDNPFRYVLLARIDDNDTITEYSCHEEVDDGVHKENYSRGYYTGDAMDAYHMLANRMIQNNRAFPKGNVSHIPGEINILVDIDALPVGSKYVW